MPDLAEKKQTEKKEAEKKDSKGKEEEDEYDPNVDDKEMPKALDEGDIAVMQKYGLGPYALKLKKTEKDISEILKNINKICGIKESDTGLAAPALWDLQLDSRAIQVKKNKNFFSVFFSLSYISF